MGVLSPIRQGDEVERLAPWGLKPKRLWSLLNMLELNASAFYTAVGRIRHIEGYFSGNGAPKVERFRPEDVLRKEDIGWIEDVRDDLIKALETLGAKVTCILAKRLLDVPSDLSDLTVERFEKRLEHLHTRLVDELTLKKLLVLEDKDADYFEPDEPLFGLEFRQSFIVVTFDLDEAGKCLALGRSTAAVFHLMRVMESGIKALAGCLGCPDPTKPAERNWAFMMREVKNAIESKWPTQKDKLTADATFFESLYASLDAVRNPWRNATMHIENKYTRDEAEHILYAVRGFMKKLASRMDENGEPKA